MVDEAYWDRKMADQLAQINRMLRVLVTIEMASIAKPAGYKMLILDKAGFTPSEIAVILGTTSNTVSVTLHKLRKRT